MQNYKFTIQYDGSRYHGWESKKNVDTIEGKLEAVFSKMTGMPVKIHGAGRTDAGVHAYAMVASGVLVTNKTTDEIKSYANRYLPDDICLVQVARASERFHARLHAVGKRYQYTCYFGSEKPVFRRAYTWVLPDWVTNGMENLDVDAMRQAAACLIGTHDFRSFCGNKKMKKSTVRTIYDITILYDKGCLTLTFHGNGFLRNMVRILTGTLLAVGFGKMSPDDMEMVLASCDRQMAGPTAPPHGLVLLEVLYE